MKVKHYYVKDMLWIVGLIVLQLLFTTFAPVRPADALSSVTVERSFISLTFQFETFSRTFYPLLTIIFVGVLVKLIFSKPRRLTLIYGLGLVLVGHISYMTQLYQLAGSTVNLSATQFLSRQLIVDQAVFAQDATTYILFVLLAVKTIVIVYEKVHHHQMTLRIKTQKNEA